MSRETKEDFWERKSHGILIYHHDGESIVFKRRSKHDKMKSKLIKLTCCKIDEGPPNILRVVLVTNMLKQLDERLINYPDPVCLKLTGQKHPYNHLFYTSICDRS